MVLRSDVEVGAYDKVAVICGNYAPWQFLWALITTGTETMIRLGFGGNYKG